MEKRRPHHFVFEGQKVEFRPGESVLTALLRQKISIDHSCGGFATCGTCRVFVLSQSTAPAPRTAEESEFANDRGFEDAERQSCQLPAAEGLILSRRRDHG